MAEQVDAADLKSADFGLVGSIPTARTKMEAEMDDIKLLYMALDFCRYLGDNQRASGMTDAEKRLASNAAQKLVQYLDNREVQK